MIAAARAERRERDARVALARDGYPGVWLRVRGACAEAAERFDLEEHAACVVLTVADAHAASRRPYERCDRGGCVEASRLAPLSPLASTEPPAPIPLNNDRPVPSVLAGIEEGTGQKETQSR